MTVAIAAPAVPMAVNPKYPNIRMGSKIKLMMEAMESEIKNKYVLDVYKRQLMHQLVHPRTTSLDY